MISKIFKKIIGSRNDRLIRSYQKVVKQINQLEPQMQAYDDAALQAMTAAFRQRLADGETLDALLPEVFAVAREASVRVMGMRHFDMQLIGGMVLNDGKIAEMRTGEGKTLTATLAVYLNALGGDGVHLVTVNDYLAERDANWMRPLYEFLGLTVGINLTNMDHEKKQEAYAADITYGTNNEFGFDYLRDNMVHEEAHLVQRPLAYAIIDEVDSILIDEARTPLIISGQVEESVDVYQALNKLIPELSRQMLEDDPMAEVEIAQEDRGDYYVDEKSKQITLTEQGHAHVEEILEKSGILPVGSDLYDTSNIKLLHYVQAALRAHALFTRDVDYIVKDNQVVIVDEHTGRLMDGRRWSDGLHQAVEAKEGVPIQMENQTLATITFQNYFRLYEKLSGMTGTADTEAYELQNIYGLEVVVVPTNEPMVRDDRVDQIFLTNKDKYNAIIDEIKKCQIKGQPVLVGTASVESSELVSQALSKVHIQHEVLNAKNHHREAKIIAQAGKPNAITIATNMAGRGTDIVLGGNVQAEIDEIKDPTDDQIKVLKEQWKKDHATVIAAGGLHVLGTERNESRRIDNQLRGRSGRQGDAGSSQFYLSMDDNLLRIFAGDKMRALLSKLGLKDGDMISHRWLNNSIESAQRKVEGLNFDMRKQLLEYDDVANDQRKVVYSQRRELMQAEEIAQTISNMTESAIDTLVNEYVPPESMEELWDLPGLKKRLKENFFVEFDVSTPSDEEAGLEASAVREQVAELMAKRLEQQESSLQDPNVMREVEKSVTLQTIDQHWRDHLATMEHLRQGIHLRGYAQKNPAQEYKRESFGLFQDLLDQIKLEIISLLCRVEFERPQAAPAPKFNMTYEHSDPQNITGSSSEAPAQQEANETSKPTSTFVRDQPKVGRNEPCPCGSGKKYKQCCGRIS